MQNAQKIIDATSRELEQSNSLAQNLIAQRAYEKWQQRGCPLGDDLQDWFAAQSELHAEARAAEQTAIERVAC